MFEEVGEAALAGLSFVAAADLDDDLEADDVGDAGGHQQEAQAIGQIVLLIGERKTLDANILVCYCF